MTERTASDQANWCEKCGHPHPEPVIWHRNFPPSIDPPAGAVASIWLLARGVWQHHHDGVGGYCITCAHPRVLAPCPDQILAQHVLAQSIILGNGRQSLAMLRTLAREADAWRQVGEVERGLPQQVSGVNVPTTYQHGPRR